VTRCQICRHERRYRAASVLPVRWHTLRHDLLRHRLSIGLTHRELADLIGTRRESVTLALNALERDGLARLEDHLLVIADEVELRQIAENPTAAPNPLSNVSPSDS
jgi:CRP-like cAMP-binding protein